MSRVKTPALLGAGVASLAISVAACGGGGGGASAPSVVGPNTNAGNALVSGVATLTIPNATKAASVRRAQFVSPSAKSLSITIGNTATVFADVSATSTFCTAGSTGRTCTIPVSAPIGTDTVSLGLYDGANGTGNLLGGGSGSQVVVLGTPFNIAAKLNAVPAAASSPVFAYTPGAAFVVGTPGTATLSLSFADADGNAIPAGTAFLTSATVVSSDANVTVTPTAWTGTSDQITVSYNGSASVASIVKITIGLGGTTTLLTIPLAFGSQSVTPLSCSNVLTTLPTVAVPGTYTALYVNGTFTTGFAPTSTAWDAYAYSVATPTPVPTPTATPTATPAPTPTPVPIATPTPVTYDFWVGTYSVPAYTVTNLFATPAPVTAPVSATNGCLLIGALVGGSSPNLYMISTLALPNVMYNYTSVGIGQITGLTFTPALAAAAGTYNATFTLVDTSNVTVTTGTMSVNAFQTITFANERQAAAFVQSHLRARAAP